MSNRQDRHGEPERHEGLSGRVRRFVYGEVSHFLDKYDRWVEAGRAGRPADPDPADPRRVRTSAEDRRAHEYDRDRGPTTPAAHPPGHAGYPEASAPVDAREDLRRQSPPREEFRGQSNTQASSPVADTHRVALLTDAAGLRAEWRRVQGTFVDDPRRAVHEASALVDRTLNEIHVNLTSSHVSETTSTEDLRVIFQRYREFFHRLLSA